MNKLYHSLTVDGETVECNMEEKRLIVTTDKTVEELTEALKKTGKEVEYIGVKAWDQH